MRASREKLITMHGMLLTVPPVLAPPVESGNKTLKTTNTGRFRDNEVNNIYQVFILVSQIFTFYFSVLRYDKISRKKEVN